MKAEAIHARCLALLQERTGLQRDVRVKMERIRTIERQVAELDARRAAAEEKQADEVDRGSQL